MIGDSLGGIASSDIEASATTSKNKNKNKKKKKSKKSKPDTSEISMEELDRAIQELDGSEASSTQTQCQNETVQLRPGNDYTSCDAKKRR